jgi:hypothetical protein
LENGPLPNLVVIQVARSGEDDDAIADCEARQTSEGDKLPEARDKAVLRKAEGNTPERLRRKCWLLWLALGSFDAVRKRLGAVPLTGD